MCPRPCGGCEAQGLVDYQPYKPVTLTPLGERLAIAMVRRHRLLETFLAEVLHYGWEEVHEDAELLEHAASERFLQRIDDVLGHPLTDPHGDPDSPGRRDLDLTAEHAQARRCRPR